MWYSNQRRSGSRPFFFSPCCRSPRLGLGLLRRPGGCCRSPARCLAGFSSLGWLAGCSPGSLPFCFERLVSLQGASGSTPLFSRGEGRGFRGWHGGAGVASGDVPSPTHGVPLTLGQCVRLYLSRLVRHP